MAEGHWVTLKNGVHVYIEDGQSAEEAVSKSIVKHVSSAYKRTGMSTSEDSSNINKTILETSVETIEGLNEKFPEIAKFISASGCSITSNADLNGTDAAILSTVTQVNPKTGELRVQALNFNPKSPELKSKKAMVDYVKKESGKNFYMPCSKYEQYLISHEYGHIVQNYLIKNTENWGKYRTDSKKLNALYNKATHQLSVEFMRFGQKQGIIKDLNKSVDNLSTYALNKVGRGDYSDMFAESFANMVSGKPNEWGVTMRHFLRSKGIGVII